MVCGAGCSAIVCVDDVVDGAVADSAAASDGTLVDGVVAASACSPESCIVATVDVDAGAVRVVAYYRPLLRKMGSYAWNVPIALTARATLKGLKSVRVLPAYSDPTLA